jgi:SPP1 gp7 family putative phage head morphogenesis protein
VPNNNSRRFMIEALRMKRRAMSARARRASSRPKRVPWLYPSVVERAYARQIAEWCAPLIARVEQWLAANAEAMLRGDHADALPGGIFRLLFSTMSGWLAASWPDPDAAEKPTAILMGLGRTATALNGFNKRQWQKQLKYVLGHEFGLAEQWWTTTAANWSRRNYSLIRSLNQTYIGVVNDLAEKAVANGWTYKALIDEIKAAGTGVTGAKARLLARDQIGKLNGQVTQARQEEAGIDKYWWRTSNDERVRGRPGGVWANARPSHWIMEGLLCRWDDATMCSHDGGKTWVPRPGTAVMEHPGQAIQCRCTADAFIEELVAAADTGLE